MDDKAVLILNGVNGATGEYLLGPLELRDVAAIVKDETPDATHVRELQRWWERVSVESPRSGGGDRSHRPGADGVGSRLSIQQRPRGRRGPAAFARSAATAGGN